MTIDDTDFQHNADSTRRLRDEDLGISLGGGWTVAVALAHLGFWDTRQVATLRHYVETDVLLGGASDNAVNAVLERLAVLADPRPVAQLGVSAAAAFDAFPAAWPDLYDAVKEASPETEVGTGFQFEFLRGGGFLSGEIHEPRWELLDRFDGSIDFIAVSSYP
jgi:hypothetical protein